MLEIYLIGPVDTCFKTTNLLILLEFCFTLFCPLHFIFIRYDINP